MNNPIKAYFVKFIQRILSKIAKINTEAFLLLANSIFFMRKVSFWKSFKQKEEEFVVYLEIIVRSLKLKK